MGSSGEGSHYEEYREEIWESTKPSQDLDDKLALLLTDPFLVAIMMTRDARKILESRIEDSAPVHAEEYREQMTDTLKKLDKNIGRLIADYARSLDNLKDCVCGECRRNAAPFN